MNYSDIFKKNKIQIIFIFILSVITYYMLFVNNGCKPLNRYVTVGIIMFWTTIVLVINGILILIKKIRTKKGKR